MRFVDLSFIDELLSDRQVLRRLSNLHLPLVDPFLQRLSTILFVLRCEFYDLGLSGEESSFPCVRRDDRSIALVTVHSDWVSDAGEKRSMGVVVVDRGEHFGSELDELPTTPSQFREVVQNEDERTPSCNRDKIGLGETRKASRQACRKSVMSVSYGSTQWKKTTDDAMIIENQSRQLDNVAELVGCSERTNVYVPRVEPDGAIMTTEEKSISEVFARTSESE